MRQLIIVRGGWRPWKHKGKYFSDVLEHDPAYPIVHTAISFLTHCVFNSDPTLNSRYCVWVAGLPETRCFRQFQAYLATVGVGMPIPNGPDHDEDSDSTSDSDIDPNGWPYPDIPPPPLPPAFVHGRAA